MISSSVEVAEMFLKENFVLARKRLQGEPAVSANLCTGTYRSGDQTVVKDVTVTGQEL